MSVRIEKDSLGTMEVPAEALYGAQTQRAVENFPISGQRFPRRFLSALGIVKRSCALANRELGRLEAPLADVVVRACDELISGALDEHFPIDVYQTGSGTSTNMNANEVVANRAIQLLGGELGSRRVHPNDHVNMGQSSNDVIPTALHVAGAVAIEEELLPALSHFAQALEAKAQAFDDIVKPGRTHLMDATPVRLGQEFGGWATQIRHGIRRAEAARDALLELALGGTAVGTGINTHPAFARTAIAHIAEHTGLPFREAEDHFEAQAARDGVVEAHGQLNVIAVSLTKIANDVRLLASGPRAGLAEIRLPTIQPGSSIMPGKVNPVQSEMLTMVAARVVGNHAAVTVGGMNGHLELNVYLPLLAVALLESVELMARGARSFTDRCVVGIEAERENCEANVERNLSLSTALAPVIGYDAAAEISKEAWKSGRTVREVALSRGILSREELDRLLDARRMTEPGHI